MVTDPLSWAESRDFCSALGASLVKMETEGENNFLRDSVSQEGRHFWIGATDSDTEGDWRWLDGTSVNKTFWSGSEPNGDTAENCVGVWGGKHWFDVTCQAKYSFICSFDCDFD